jgi:hypothetical protein
MSLDDSVVLVADSFKDRVSLGLNPGHKAAMERGEDPRLVYEAELRTRVQVLSQYKQEGMLSDDQIEKIIDILKEKYSDYLDELRGLLSGDSELSSFASVLVDS